MADRHQDRPEDRREHQRVASLAPWYGSDQLDIDRRLVGFRYRTIRPHLKGPYGLELGPADGEMTALLLADFEDLTIVEGSRELLDSIDDDPRLHKIHSLFEDFEPDRSFDTIVMEHILEHVADPVALLRRAATWMAPDARIVAGVPNGHSIHRLVAAAMGLIDHPCALNDRDHALGHRRVYTPHEFRSDVEEAGLRVVQAGGVFLKPLSNGQMQEWTDEMLEGFYEVGQQFPDNSAELFLVAVAR